MRRLWRGTDDLEARLRASRPEPRPEFLYAVVGRLKRNRRALTLRVAFASVLTVIGLVVFGTAGGIGYASSAAHSLVSSITTQGNNPGQGNGNGNGNGNNNTTTTTTDTTTTTTASSNSDPGHGNNGNGNNGNGNGNNGNNGTTTTTTTTISSNSSNNNVTPADDQYKPGCGLGDPNHDHSGPPGQVKKGNADATDPCPPFP
jgi:hypothetical protein